MKTRNSERTKPIRKLKLVNQKIAVAVAMSKQKNAAGTSAEGSDRADLGTFSPKAVQIQYEPDSLLLAQGKV